PCGGERRRRGLSIQHSTLSIEQKETGASTLKTSALLTIIFATALPVSAFAFTGIVVGNGGHIVACHDDNGNLVAPEALDLYEGRMRGYKYPADSEFLDPLKLAR